MPFTSIPTVATGDVISAAYLNLLGANQEFLYGLANQANIPFNGVRAVVEELDSDNGVWSIRHRLQYLHYRVLSESGNSPTSVLLYYDGYRVLERTDVAFNHTGAVDLLDPETWPGFIGAPAAGIWTTATAYSNSDNGGDIVSNDGDYYYCYVGHTSDAAKEPGVGVDWEDYWQLIEFTVGSFYQSYFVVTYVDPGNQVTIEYLFEASTSTL
jgi:hypothetical protein